MQSTSLTHYHGGPLYNRYDACGESFSTIIIGPPPASHHQLALQPRVHLSYDWESSEEINHHSIHYYAIPRIQKPVSSIVGSSTTHWIIYS